MEKLLVMLGLKKKVKRTWIDRIIRANRTGSFTLNDIDLAVDWVTCACGEQDADIPRNLYNAPCDLELNSLGCLFCRYVYNNDVEQALLCLIQIQKRAKEVLQEQHDTKGVNS